MVSSGNIIGRKFGPGKKFLPDNFQMTYDMVTPAFGFLKISKAIRCTLPNCMCECFAPGKLHLRSCDTCKHGWVAHALDKLGYQHIFHMGMQVEIVQPNIVFDIASLMLYGAQATPIRLKILLDRLFSVLQHEEVLQVLHGFGWSYEDYARGYILQDASGRVLDKWTIATREEEHIILQQFLRFGETKSIAQEIILQDTKEKQELYVKQTSRAESEIKKFIERSNLSMQSYMRPYESRHLFSNRMPFVSHSSNRLVAPTAIQYTATTPPRDLRPTSMPPTPVPTSSPVTSSPLGRLQTMLPIDFRRERLSPAVSPGLSEKRASVPQLSQPPLPPPPPPLPSHGDESPKNLSTTPTPTPTSTSPPQFQSMKPPDIIENSKHAPCINMPNISPVIISQEDSPMDAINYSTKDCEESALSVYADRKVKHLRKSANPIKRQWTPSASFGSTLIAPNGKKRVLCTACNKTFCDKGALKIHYSAVHLKEMHKCTVEGCSMMFSSRRSRNRHSANPNPKLHMPQKRKLPEGATLIAESKPPSRLINSPPTMVVTSSYLSRAVIPSLDSNVLNRSDQSCFVDVGNNLSYMSSGKKIKMENNDGSNEAIDMTDDVKSLDDTLKPDVSSTQRGFNRRKSLIPTRCAQMEENYSMSDENSISDEKDATKHNKKCLNDAEKVKSTSNSAADDELDDKIAIKKEIADVREIPEKSMSGKVYDSVILSSHSGVICDTNCNPKQEPRKEACHFPRIASLLANNNTNNNSNNSSDPVDLSQDNCERSPSNLSSLNMSPGSDHDSNASQASTDIEGHLAIRANGSHSPDSNSNSTDIPLDKDNPRKCNFCGKILQNHFDLKIHYQSVHYKLMHKCTIDGCNAVFPSKRSRDRHSTNLNLHHKLLSTSDTDQFPDDEEIEDVDELDEDDIDDVDDDDEDNSEGMRGGNKENNQVKDHINQKYDSRIYNENSNHGIGDEDSNPNTVICNKRKTISSVGSHSNDSFIGNNSRDRAEENTFSARNGGDESGAEEEDDDDDDGGDHLQDEDIDDELNSAVSCHVCQQKFRDNLALKEHFETLHPKEMYYCTVSGCDKIFSTRKSRNRHTQNHNLHRHLSSMKTNGLS
ncbi:zinc finger protein basonuclin-2-like isoform X2 [Octopus sinensis]|uniref:Zinc finger protein basonuclin-2-like isoform X2 n=1 Tax=Octopus sinensis TaxID=2607531 RepID=A0A7E6ELL5_9MOLL|nr:zinc finger protein basonuclin-2-like isoform X2 [Octopus sinensis]